MLAVLHETFAEQSNRFAMPSSLFSTSLVPLLAAVLTACSNLNADARYRLVQAFEQLSFTRPVDLQDPRDGSGRLFVVEQAGVIRVFPNDPAAEESRVFLDIRPRVNDSGNEEGLLGLAFHPEYKSNGYFFVDYTASSPRRTVIARFRVDASDPDRADPESEHVILEVGQPYGNHNAGQIVFGPDGYLYISFGDGGSGGDPQGHGQNQATLLGTLLRVDVDNPSDGQRYGIPADNPYVGNDRGWREEIWAYGLRNPWRFSFDRETGDLWTGDVGQNAYEEIDVIEKGGNYGWNVMEGFACYGPSSGCDETGLTPPVWAYGRSLGISVTGGFVYRGDRLPHLVGKYLYADYGSGRVWALYRPPSGEPQNEELMNSRVNISSFGEDGDGEVFLLGFDGRVYLVDRRS